ncbi:hypothetical protein OF83DRAFT_1175271 [Amylostereum chailletii]|nr:hypothetical protein OF83DRAFT_1175271 [Amylostereum chailletii]
MSLPVPPPRERTIRRTNLSASPQVRPRTKVSRNAVEDAIDTATDFVQALQARNIYLEDALKTTREQVRERDARIEHFHQQLLESRTYCVQVEGQQQASLRQFDTVHETFHGDASTSSGGRSPSCARHAAAQNPNHTCNVSCWPVARHAFRALSVHIGEQGSGHESSDEGSEDENGEDPMNTEDEEDSYFSLGMPPDV